MTKLPSKKHGRPLLLGEKLDTEIKCYIQAVHEGGGVVTLTITMAVATAIVGKHDRTYLKENGVLVMITKTWAQSLLQRMSLMEKVVRPYKNLIRFNKSYRTFPLFNYCFL